MNKNYEFGGGQTTGQFSPELLRSDFTERSQRNWEMVLERKHQNTDQKQRHMKELLAKKFKRENEMEAKNKEQREIKEYNLEKHNEKLEANFSRKKTTDQQLEQRKNREHRESLKKEQLAKQRRLEFLNERA